jgi:SAM-dependent methyltransferase
MLISNFRGMKYPTEYVIRFFFKEFLHLRKGIVLELGCGNGNNLMLFYQYEWNVQGIDIDDTLVNQANFNFERVASDYGLSNKYSFNIKDMVDFVEQYHGDPFDVLMLPHSICYLSPERIEMLFQLLKERSMVGKDSFLFLTVRSPDDYRFGRGNQVGDKSFILNIEETGEMGRTNTFCTRDEIVGILNKMFSFEYLLVTRQEYENYNSGILINNSEITFWGKIKAVL